MLKVALQDDRFSLRQELRNAMSVWLDSQDAQRVASVCDPKAPWHFLALRGGVEIMSAQVDPQRATAMQSWIGSLPKAGTFGARKLAPKRGARRKHEWFIWTGPRNDQLLVAPSLRGLVTALNLKAPQTELLAQLIPAGLTAERRAQLEVPDGVRELNAKGPLSRLSVDLKVDSGTAQRIAALPLRSGPIPNLLRDSSLVWSGSGTWTQAKAEVRKVLSRVRSQVADLPFLVRPTAEDLEQRLIRSAKQWDGRSVIALDQRGTLRVALGVKSTSSSESATLGLIQAAIPNLQLMRSFSTDVPSARLVQQRARSNGLKVHELILSDVAGQLPRDLHGLLSRRRQLNVAMAWAPGPQALLLSIGPEAVPSMMSWIQSSRSGESVFDGVKKPVLMQARTTMAASMILNLLESGQGVPSIGQLLRMRSATPRQDYAVSMTPLANDSIHLDLRLEQESL